MIFDLTGSNVRHIPKQTGGEWPASAFADKAQSPPDIEFLFREPLQHLMMSAHLLYLVHQEGFSTILLVSLAFKF